MGRYRKGEKELGVGLSYCIAVGDRSQNESIASSKFYNQMRCQSVLVFLWELQGRARYPSRQAAMAVLDKSDCNYYWNFRESKNGGETC